MAYVEPAPPRRALPIALVVGGATFFVALLPLGEKATVAGAIAFLIAAILAVADSARPVFTWPNAIVTLVAVIWFIPIKLYSLPISLPFNLEPYRLLLLVLVGAWLAQVAIRRGRLDGASRGDPILLLIAVAVTATVVNYDALVAADLTSSPINTAAYFLSFLLIFVLIASVVEDRATVDLILKTMLLCAFVVAVFAIYEARSQYNYFAYLDQYIPLLEKQERDVVELRGGQLRVMASAQHPIAFGVALIMMLPIAVYLAKQASTRLRAKLWVGVGLVCAMAAVTTVSRTTVMMLITMAIVALKLRGASIVRYWPVLLILPVAVHFVAPGAMGGLYKAFFPKEGLIGDVTARAGEGGSGRFADVVPGLKLWAEQPIVGHGLGALIVFDPEETKLGPAPPVAVIFDNQYMSTIVELGLLGFLGVIALVWGSAIRLYRAAKHSTGPPSDLFTACAISCFGFGVAMFFFDAFAFAQCTIIFVFLAALGLRVARVERVSVRKRYRRRPAVV